MSQIDHIAELHRAFNGDAWHGPAVLELLADVDSRTAAAHPIKGAHSIWEIVHHLLAWKRAVPIRIRGEVIELEGEQDWPPPRETSDARWQKTIAELSSAHAGLVEAVRHLKDSDLTLQVPNRSHNIHFLLDGMAQHDLYHAGQIAMLKKAARP